MVRAKAFVVFLVLVSVMMGGCVSSGQPSSEVSDSPGSTLESTQESAAPAQAGNGTGALEGVVANENAAPIWKAFVLLVGSRNSTSTDRDGRFSLSHVPPGKYVLRVDAETYRTLESHIEIRPETVTRVNVTLVPLVDRGAGFREHLHDFWGDDATKILFEETVNYEQSLASGGKQGVDECIYNPSTGSPIVSGGGCPRAIKLYLPDGVIVYPGTSKLSIKVSWSSPYVTEVGFRFIPANETTVKRAILPLKNAEERSVDVAYPMTDHGHQTFSVWTFEIVPEIRFQGLRVFSFADFNRRYVGPFHVTLTAHRGAVPAEPAHPMFWTNSSEIVLVERMEKRQSGLPTGVRNPTETSCLGTTPCFVLPAGTVVPPGTTRLRATLEIQYGTPAAAPLFTEKTLAFRTAAVNPRDATFADLRVEPASGSGLKKSWELRLEPGEADSFYQKRSLWTFFLSHQGREREDRFVNECFNYSAAGCGDSIYRLTVVAINDDFTPT